MSGADVLVAAIAAGVAFDFTNGVHDTATAIETSVSTRALTPRQAVILAAVLNLVGALVTVLIFGAVVSNTIAGTLNQPTVVMIVAALLGAIAWNLATWYVGLPSSSTHALVGALIGAGIAAAGFGMVNWAQVGKIVTFLVVSPPLGFVVAALFMLALYRLVRRWRPYPLNRAFRLLQIGTSAFISYSYGANDAQKSMAAMSLALLATGKIDHFHVPARVVAPADGGWLGSGAIMMTAWVLTIPSSAVIGWLAYAILHTARVG